MKRLQISLVLVMISMSASLFSQQKSASEIIYEAIYNEEITGQLDKATGLLNQVLKDFPTSRADCAQALYHLGMIAEKSAKEPAPGSTRGQESKSAESYYVRVIEKYPDVAEYADLARARIAKLKDANTFIDPRDGHKYRWVKIGSQIWMAENLAYMPHINPPKKQEDGIWVYDYDGEDVAEAKATENYQKYGCLYDWAMAMNIDTKYLEQPWNGNSAMHQGICPPGWHLPTDGEWKTLEKSLGMPDSLADVESDIRAGIDLYSDLSYPPIGKYIKSASGWFNEGNGDNSSGFGALPAGWREALGSRSFDQLGYNTYFWATSDSVWAGTRYDPEKSYVAYTRNLESKSFDVSRWALESRVMGYSVRCVRYTNPRTDTGTSVNITRKEIASKSLTISEKDIAIQRKRPDLLKKYILPLGDKPLLSKVSFLVEDSVLFLTYYKSTQIVALNAVSLDTIWSYDAGEAFITSKVFLEGNHLICQTRNHIISLGKFDGKPQWKRSGNFSLNNSNVHNNILIVPKMDTLWAISIDNGIDVWRKPLGLNKVAGVPEISDSLVFLPLSNQTSRETRPMSIKKAPILYAFDIRSGEDKWTFESYGYTFDCLYAEDSVFVVPTSNENGNYFFSLDAATGKEKTRSYLSS